MSQERKGLTPTDLSTRKFNAMRGRLCSIIESMGLPHEQERAAISLIKQETYDVQKVIDELLSICSEVRVWHHPSSIREV